MVETHYCELSSLAAAQGGGGGGGVRTMYELSRETKKTVQDHRAFEIAKSK